MLASPIKFNSKRCSVIAERIWHITFASIPLDIIIFKLLETPERTSSDLYTIALALLCLSALGFFNEFLLTQTNKLAHIRNSFTNKYSAPLVAVAVIISLTEIVVKMISASSAKSAFIIAVIALLIAYSSYRKFSEMRSSGIKLISNIPSQIERLNLAALSIAIAPIITCRLSSILAAIYYAHGLGNAYGFIAFIITATFLILTLKPANSFFQQHCKSCSSLTSRALITYGYCPHCKPEKFTLEANHLNSQINWNIIRN